MNAGRSAALGCGLADAAPSRPQAAGLQAVGPPCVSTPMPHSGQLLRVAAAAAVDLPLLDLLCCRYDSSRSDVSQTQLAGSLSSGFDFNCKEWEECDAWEGQDLW